MTAGACYHCGEPLPAGAAILADFDGEQQAVCCFGCKAVAEMIYGNGLSAYYQHRTQPGPDAGLRAEVADWSLYDSDDLVNRYVSSDGTASTATIEIGGMYCSACAWLFDTALKRVEGVSSVALNSATHRAVLGWDAERLSFSELLAAIGQIGFKPAPVAIGTADNNRHVEQRQALRRLIVAAAAGMQVMMFAVALYAGEHFGIEGRIEEFLRLVSLLVCVPIVVYSARPFFASAWRGLRSRQPGMDLPVSIAVLAAFSASAVATLSGRGEVYFDSVAMFVLFLGGARYLEMRARHGAEDASEALGRLLPELATRLAGDKPEVVSIDRLRPADRVLIRAGEVIPADGRVLAGQLAVDEALLTGEPMPVTRGVGSEVFAGGINRSGTGSIEVTRTGASTSVAEIGRLLERARANRPRIALLADRIARRFVIAVLFVAAATGICWLWLDPSRAFEIVLATLVVTCPCALSLAMPASLAAAATRLSRDGILLIHARVLDVLAGAAHIVFDKTGTLTRGRPGITGREVWRAGMSPAACEALAAALETCSEHVLARAFAPSLEPGRFDVVAANVEPGQGVEGLVDGRLVRLGSLAFVAGVAGDAPPTEAPDPGSTLAWLGDEQGFIARFSIGDALRPDARAALDQLRQLGHSIGIASGDRESTVAMVAEKLGVQDWQGRLDPAGKLDWLAKRRRDGRPVVMVGDGINDAPVLAAADSSVAIDAGTALARASADCVVPGRRLASVTTLAVVAGRTKRIVRQNLAWAIAYNLCAVPLAVSGVLAPWMAALGMSLSSLLVVMNALRLNRPVEIGAAPQTSARRTAEEEMPA